MSLKLQKVNFILQNQEFLILDVILYARYHRLYNEVDMKNKVRTLHGIIDECAIKSNVFRMKPHYRTEPKFGLLGPKKIRVYKNTLGPIQIEITYTRAEVLLKTIDGYDCPPDRQQIVGMIRTKLVNAMKNAEIAFDSKKSKK